MDIQIMDLKEATQRFKHDRRTRRKPPKAFYYQPTNELYLISCNEHEAIAIILHETIHDVLYRTVGFVAHAKFDNVWKPEIWLSVLSWRLAFSFLYC